MKKWLALGLAMMMFWSFALAEDGEEMNGETVVLIVGDREVTAGELKDAVMLHMFEAALRCAGYGYEYDITEYLNIADATDKVLFDLESREVIRALAEERGLLPLSEERRRAAAEEAEKEWEAFREIAWSEYGLAFLPAGDYEYVEGETEENLDRYFASFGLTRDVLREDWEAYETDRQIMQEITAFMAEATEDEKTDYYSNWFVEEMDASGIVVYDDLVEQLMEEIYEGYYDDQGDGDFEAYERSLMIGDDFFTLGDDTVFSFESRGWKWNQEADGSFTLNLPGTDSRLRVRTEKDEAGGKLVMADVTDTEGVEVMYLGYPAGREDTASLRAFLEEIYGGKTDEQGILQARTDVQGGTLRMEVGERGIRLTLEAEETDQP